MTTGGDSLTVTIAGKDVGLEAVLKKVDAEMAKSADQAVKLGQSYARLAQAQGQPVAASKILAGTLAQTTGASEKAIISLETQSARLASGSSAFAQFGQSAASSLTAMIGPAALATAAIGGLIAVGKSFADAFQLKASLDATTLAVNAQIKGIRDSGQVWSQAAGFAKEFKLTQEETTAAIQASIGVMRSSKAPIEDILGVLARMQVLSPEQSLEEAAIALKSLASGDTTSLVTRFEVSRDVANEMKQEIQGGADAVAVMSKFLGDTGIGMDVLKTKTEGASGAMKDLAVANERLALAQAEFAQGPGMLILEGQIRLVSGATRLLTGDFAAMGESLKNAGVDFSVSAAGASAYAGALMQGQGPAAALAAANQAAATATDLLTTAQVAGSGGGGTWASAEDAAAAAAVTATAAAAALTTEIQGTAEAAVLAAAQHQAQSAATAVLTAQTQAATSAFLALNPNIDAAGIAAAVAAGKIPALVGQLANLRIAAYSARDAVAALAAQQAINTKSLVAPGGVGIGAPGITSGRNNDIDAVLKLQKANKDTADARSDQILQIGSQQAQLNELQRQYNDAVKTGGADSADAIKAETRLRKEQISAQKAATKAAKGGGGGGGGVKLSDTQKLNNSLLASQEQYAQKSEDAEGAHLDRLLTINQDFSDKMLKAQQDFGLAQVEGRASFYDTLGGIEDAGLQQALSAQYEAAFAEADKIAQEKGADVGQKFLEARQAAIQAQGQRASEIAQATKDGDKDKAEYLAGVDKLYRDAEQRKLDAITSGQDTLAAQRDQALADEGAKYADAQAKIGDSADTAAQRKILAAERSGKAIDVEALKVDGLKASYDALGVAGSRAGITPAAGATGATPAATAAAGVTAAPAADPVVAALDAIRAAVDAAANAIVGAEKDTGSAVRGLTGKFAS